MSKLYLSVQTIFWSLNSQNVCNWVVWSAAWEKENKWKQKMQQLVEILKVILELIELFENFFPSKIQ